MKYLLVVILLVLAHLTGHAGSPPSSLPMRLELDASFDVVIGRSVENVYVTVADWPDHARVALHVDEVSTGCGRDTSCSGHLFSGDGRALVRLGDVVIARNLEWATIHVVIPFTADLTHQTIMVKIDLAMYASGEFHRGDGNDNPGYYSATAKGVVASAGTTFVDTRHASVSGMIARTALW